MKDSKNRKRLTLEGESGFTLLELMIALGILSIIFSVIYGTFNNVYRSTRHMEDDAERYRLARLGMYYLSNDLSMSYMPPSIAGNSESGNTVFIGESSEHLLGNASFPNDTVFFSAASHRRLNGFNAPESELLTIRYSLSDHYLIQETTLSNGRIVINELGGPLEGLSFRYLDRSGKEWHDHWDASENNQKLPRAVEIELILKSQGRSARRFKTWVDIPMGRS